MAPSLAGDETGAAEASRGLTQRDIMGGSHRILTVSFATRTFTSVF